MREACKELKEKLNQNGYTGGLFRIECLPYRPNGIEESEDPTPFVSKHGTTLVSVTNY